MAETGERTFHDMQRDMKLSKLDGVYSNIMTTTTTGVFLTGFALALGLDNVQIGIMAALPAFANLFQIFGSYFVQKTGSARKICLVSVFSHRILWIMVAGLPLLDLIFNLSDSLMIFLFLAGIASASIFAAVSSVSWMSWISDIITEAQRGKFFGRRNMILGLAGITTGLLGGFFIDIWESSFPGLESAGFSILILGGVLFGFFSWYMLSKTSAGNLTDEIEIDEEMDRPETYFRSLRRCLRDKTFRDFLIFSMLWGFAVGLSSPFFNVYMIETLDINFSQIALFGVISGCTNALGMQLWGNVIDRSGTRTLLYITSLGGSMTPLLWVFTSPANYLILWPIHLLSGLVWSGIGLATSLLLMQLVKRRYKSIYFAIFAALTGLTMAIAPIIGGYIAGAGSGFKLSFGIFSLEGMQFIFLLTGLMRLSTLGFLRRVDLPQQLPVKELLKKSRRHLVPARGAASLGTLGLQSLENINLAFARGLINARKTLKKIAGGS